ncbi:hypothetical protein HA402_009201 [Bradysia odoriphaga]|nr:hypothetical protein HA402_009201 [Bradysia odoriphaga]
MPYYSESSYASGDASDDDVSEDDGYVWCKHCSNRMPETSLQPHILNKHCISCKYCNARVLPASMNGHIQTKHQVETLTEEVQRLRVENDKLSSRQAIGFTHNFNDDQFNKLVAQRKIYSENNVIYRVK